MKSIIERPCQYYSYSLEEFLFIFLLTLIDSLWLSIMHPNPAHLHAPTISALCPCNLPCKTKQGRTRKKKEKERNISFVVEVWCGPGSHTHISLFTPFSFVYKCSLPQVIDLVPQFQTLNMAHRYFI